LGLSASEAEAWKEDSVQRLCQFFGLSPSTFLEQFDLVLPVAQSHKDADPDISNPEAWRRAVASVSRRANKPALDSLIKVLCSWVAWSPSTSGLEQNFSQAQRVHGSRMSSLGDQRLLDLLTIVVDQPAPQRRAEIITEAQKLYLAYFGCARKRTPAHLRRRGRRSGTLARPRPGTEASFMKKRSDDVKRLHLAWVKAGKFKDAKRRIDDKSRKDWNERMQAEAGFQQAKRQRRLIAAVQENQVLKKELATTDQAEVRRAIVEQRKRHTAAVAAHERKQSVLSTPTPRVITMRGERFFRNGLNVPPGSTRGLGMIEVTARERATVFAVAGLEDVGQRCLWHLVLRGGRAVTTNYLTTGGADGLVVTYKACTHVAARQVWCSPRFSERHATLLAILQCALNAVGCRWRSLEGQVDDFINASRRLNRRNTGLMVIGLVTPTDLRSIPVMPAKF